VWRLRSTAHQPSPKSRHTPDHEDRLHYTEQREHPSYADAENCPPPPGIAWIDKTIDDEQYQQKERAYEQKANSSESSKHG
jgi:hypothetical protein